jgi:hypothetical protein
LELYESGQIEVGFSTFGPTLGLFGTLRALHQEMFVSNIQVHVTRESDSSIREFQWAAFRPNTITLAPAAQQPLSFETASGFMVSQNAPRRFNIFFIDPVTQGLVGGALMKAWDAFSKIRAQIGFEDIAQLAYVDPARAKEKLTALAEEYTRHPGQLEAYNRLGKLCYWQAGTYRLAATIGTTRPDRSFQRSWRFEVSEADAHQLELNIIAMLWARIDAESGKPGRPYFFAYPKYEAP